MMRIGFITGEFPPMHGGIGAYTHILAETLTAQGADVSIISDSRASSPNATYHLSSSIDQWDGRAWLTLRQWVRDRRLDLVHLQYQTAAFAMSPWIHFLPDVLNQTPSVTTFHDLRPPYLFPKAGKLRDQIVRWLARRSTGVIATNHEDFAELKSHPLSVLIPIGSNIMPQQLSTQEARSALNLGSDDIIIGYFGLINRSKGLDTLIQAVAQLQPHLPCTVLIIGGTTGENDPTNRAYAAEITALIAAYQMGQQVRFTGYLSETEVSTHLQACTLIALPYRDGASFRRGSLMAALAHGRPILSTHPAITIDDFLSGDNLLLVPPNDPQALAEGIQQITANANLQMRLSVQARALAQQFEWPAIAQSHFNFYTRLLESRS